MSTLRELEVEQVSNYLLEVLRRQGMINLTEFQANAVDTGIIRGDNQILVTHDYDEAYQIAEIALLNRAASDFKARAIILCPTAHLAEKRMRSVGQKCTKLGVESVAVIRRRNVTAPETRRGRVMVATFESMNIALRAHPSYLDDIACVLVERLDLIGQPRIGTMLENVLVTMMTIDKLPQFVAVTPPVADIDDLSKWLKAKVVTDPKPEVNRIFSVKSFESIDESVADLTEFVQYKRGQTMILSPNMASSEDLALRLAKGGSVAGAESLDLRLTMEQRDALRQLVMQVARTFPNCDLTRRLTSALIKGVAFVHEGLPKSHRRVISSAWEDGTIPVIVMPSEFAVASELKATAVFLLGVFTQSAANELSRHEDLVMLSEWQLAEVLHAAGRPGRDNDAFGIVVVDSPSEKHRVFDKFFETDRQGNIRPVLGEVDSLLDDSESVQDLILSRLCSPTAEAQDPFALLNRTYWASRNRVTGSESTSVATTEDTDAETLLARRATQSTIKRAREVPDSSVKLVSVNPIKIEGLIHSGTRELWHYVALRSTEGASCSCESWKFQGVRRHRLCKHLVKLAQFALKSNETRNYASSIIRQSLRGLGALDSLESDGLVIREGKTIRCSSLGRSVVMLGVPAGDARMVMKTISKPEGSLKDVLIQVVVANIGLPRDIVKRVLDSIPADGIDKIVCEDDLPGIIENILEEVQYVNSVLLRIMSGEAREGLNKASLKMQTDIMRLLDQM